MSRILILYGTSEGHTAKVAARMAETLRAAGADVDVAVGVEGRIIDIQRAIREDGCKPGSAAECRAAEHVEGGVSAGCCIREAQNGCSRLSHA